MNELELKPEETILLDCVLTHKETGLVVGVKGPVGDVQGFDLEWPRQRVAFFEPMFVVGVSYDMVTEYRVQNPLDILKLFEIIKAKESYAYLAMSPAVVTQLMEEAKSE